MRKKTRIVHKATPKLKQIEKKQREISGLKDDSKETRFPLTALITVLAARCRHVGHTQAGAFMLATRALERPFPLLPVWGIILETTPWKPVQAGTAIPRCKKPLMLS
jgi:hypothetical protein